MQRRHRIGLAALCLMAGSRWLVEATWPALLPPLLGQSLCDALAGAIALLFLRFTPRRTQTCPPPIPAVALAGLFLLGVPFILQQFAPAISPETTVALYALVPLCTIVGVAHTRNDGSRAAMLPSLAGFAGVLLLLPWRPPSTPAASLAFGVTIIGVVLTATGGVWTHFVATGRPVMESVATIALANAGVLGLAGAMRGERLVPLARGDYAAIGFAVPQLFLLGWLVTAVAPERLTSRFFLAPLVTLIEGALLLRPQMGGRPVIGFLLLLLGTRSLLSSRNGNDVPLSLR